MKRRPGQRKTLWTTAPCPTGVRATRVLTLSIARSLLQDPRRGSYRGIAGTPRGGTARSSESFQRLSDKITDQGTSVSGALGRPPRALRESSKSPVPTVTSLRKSSRLAEKDVSPGRFNEKELSKRSMSPEKADQVDAASAGDTGSPSRKPATGTGGNCKIPGSKTPSRSPKKAPITAPASAPVEETSNVHTTRSRSRSPIKEHVEPTPKEISTVRGTRSRNIFMSPSKDQIKGTSKNAGWCGNGGIAVHEGGMKQKVVLLRELWRAVIYTSMLSKRVIEGHMSTAFIAY
jgi:hypothetical protein